MEASSRSAVPRNVLSIARRGDAAVRTLVATALLLAWGITACAPKVQIQAPKEPIVINLNIKIEHEIRVKVDKDLEGMFEEDSELF